MKIQLFTQECKVLSPSSTSLEYDLLLYTCHFNNLTYLSLTSRFNSEGVVRKNGAPNATVSTYHFHLVHCHQLLHTCPRVGPHDFYVTFLQYLWYCVLEGQTRSPPTSLTAHFSILHLFCYSFITHSFDVPKSAEHVLLHSQCAIFASPRHSVFLFIADSIS